VASIDLPLHGARASSKLTERFLGGLGQPEPDADAVWTLLWDEFLRQAIADLDRALSALSTLGGGPPGRVVCVGTGLAAATTAAFCSADPRPNATALAPGPPIFGAAEAQASAALARFAPRPVLIVEDGPAARTLAQAAGSPVSSIDAESGDPEAALRAATPFVLDQLGVGG